MREEIMLVRTTVILTVEVDLTDSWNTSAPISQIQEQASRSAVNRLTNNLDITGVRIKDKPRVQMIIVEKQP